MDQTKTVPFEWRACVCVCVHGWAERFQCCNFAADNLKWKDTAIVGGFWLSPSQMTGKNMKVRLVRRLQRTCTDILMRSGSTKGQKQYKHKTDK